MAIISCRRNCLDNSYGHYCKRRTCKRRDKKYGVTEITPKQITKERLQHKISLEPWARSTDVFYGPHIHNTLFTVAAKQTRLYDRFVLSKKKIKRSDTDLHTYFSILRTLSQKTLNRLCLQKRVVLIIYTYILYISKRHKHELQRTFNIDQ